MEISSKIYALMFAGLAFSITLCQQETYPTLSLTQTAGIAVMMNGVARKSIGGLALIGFGYVISKNARQIEDHMSDPRTPANKVLRFASITTQEALADIVKKAERTVRGQLQNSAQNEIEKAASQAATNVEEFVKNEVEKVVDHTVADLEEQVQNNVFNEQKTTQTSI